MRSLLLLDLTCGATGAGDADAVIALADTASLAGEALQHLCAQARTFVSVGPLGRRAFDTDLAAATRAPIDGIALPGCRSGADLQHLAAKLAVAEAETGRPDGTLGIVAAVAGTAGAVLDLGSLVGASRRLRAIIFDAASLGAVLAPDGMPFANARALSLIAAKAAGVPAYDQLRTADVDACCDAARRDGFAGLLTVGPDTLAIINARFAPGAMPATDA